MSKSEIFGLIGETKNARDLGISDIQIIEIYKKIFLTRTLDTKILSIQRQGRIGPYVPCTGEEAAIVGATYAMMKEDWLFSSYRELGAHLVRGLSVDLVFAQLFGNSNDLLKGRQMSNSWGSRDLRDVPTAAPIGAYLPVSVGLSIAAAREKKRIAVLAFLGDGGTSASDFHAAMNFAGVYKAPIVFLCRNNGWAISLPVSKQTASETLAIKARAYGFEGIRVDGNDALAVFETTRKALNRARSGDGPTFIEAVTYRVGPHSTADDPSKYRGKDDPSSSKKIDPIVRMKDYLISNSLWSEEKDGALLKEYEELVSKSIQRQESVPLLTPTELIFGDVYSQSNWILDEEKRDFEQS